MMRFHFVCTIHDSTSFCVIKTLLYAVATLMKSLQTAIMAHMNVIIFFTCAQKQYAQTILSHRFIYVHACFGHTNRQ